MLLDTQNVGASRPHPFLCRTGAFRPYVTLYSDEPRRSSARGRVCSGNWVLLLEGVWAAWRRAGWWRGDARRRDAPSRD